MSDKLRVTASIEKVYDSGGKLTLPDIVRSYPFINGSFNDVLLIDNEEEDTQVTPVEIDISNFENLNGVIIFGTYVENDFANGITAGDPAKIQVAYNGNDFFMEAEAHLMLGFKPTAIEIKAQGTRKIRVGSVYCAAE